ncbi:MAG: amino acid permease [Spirochaetes bacterium]|nr:amino acid permease [Spirochaetota bacterium]
MKEFKRELGFLDSTMLIVGSMIGSGIFIVSADIARNMGSAGYLMLVWMITGAVTCIGALSYGELAAMMPGAGGQYIYLREAYNPLVGFLYGWTLFFVIQTGTISAVAVAFAKFASVFLPALGEKNVIAVFSGFGLKGSHLTAIFTIILLTYINSKGIHAGKLFQDGFTIIKVAALVILIAVGFVLGWNPSAVESNLSGFWERPPSVSSGFFTSDTAWLAGLSVFAAICVSMVGSLFSSDAWNNITFTAGEVVNPQRNIPLSLAVGTGLVSLIYIAVNFAYIVMLPVAGSPDAPDAFGRGIQFAADDRVAVAAVSHAVGNAGSFFMAAVIMVSTFGCNNGLIISGARVYYAMARDGYFFEKAGNLNSKNVPGFALFIQAAWSGILCLTGTYGDLLDYVIFSVLIFYMLTVAGIFILRKKKPNAERPYRAFGYPVLPAVYIIAALFISVNLLIFKPKYTWPGLLIVITGVPVYFIWKKISGTSDSGV